MTPGAYGIGREAIIIDVIDEIGGVRRRSNSRRQAVGVDDGRNGAVGAAQ